MKKFLPHPFVKQSFAGALKLLFSTRNVAKALDFFSFYPSDKSDGNELIPNSEFIAVALQPIGSNVLIPDSKFIAVALQPIGSNVLIPNSKFIAVALQPTGDIDKPCIGFSRKLLLLLCLQLTILSTQAQDYLSGDLVDKQNGAREIFYDRTQNDIAFNIYQTVYKVVDLKKKPLYTINLTHDRNKGVVLISVKKPNTDPWGRSVSYERSQCGLIFSDPVTADTTFDLATNYNHLFSFTDTMRTYPVLHKIKTYDKKELLLDPITKLRIRKHNEIMAGIITPQRQNAFNHQLIALRDTLYAKHTRFNDAIVAIRSQIEKDVNLLMKNKRVDQDVKRYEGEKRFGHPHGKGLQVLNGNIYAGNFKEGNFVSGNVVLNANGTEYCGQYLNNNRSGTGWTKSENGGYLLGIYKDNELIDGVALQKSKDGEVYFGGYNNGKRNGYGELQNHNGGKYAGEFRNDRLVKGYAKEVDQFGYYTYSHIENGAKISIDAKTAEEFFGLTLSSDKFED